MIFTSEINAFLSSPLHYTNLQMDVTNQRIQNATQKAHGLQRSPEKQFL